MKKIEFSMYKLIFKLLNIELYLLFKSQLTYYKLNYMFFTKFLSSDNKF
jgi:hypothetical protein